jgi:hypothetical protein
MSARYRKAVWDPARCQMEKISDIFSVFHGLDSFLYADKYENVGLYQELFRHYVELARKCPAVGGGNANFLNLSVNVGPRSYGSM